MAEPPPPYSAYSNEIKQPLDSTASPHMPSYGPGPSAPPPEHLYEEVRQPAYTRQAPMTLPDLPVFQNNRLPPLEPRPQNQPLPTHYQQPVYNVTQVVHIKFGPRPCDLVCPFCHTHTETRIKHESGVLAWLLCGALFFFGFWLCCCCPFCIDSCMDVDHFCPQCGKFLGRYKRL